MGICDDLSPEVTAMEIKWMDNGFGHWVKKVSKIKILEEVGKEEAFRYARFQEEWANRRGGKEPCHLLQQ